MEHDPTALLTCTLECVTDGERRACATATVRELRPGGVFIVTPVSLREIAGAEITWNDPHPGEPIMSLTAVRNQSDATDLLRWWSCKTLAEHAPIYR